MSRRRSKPAHGWLGTTILVVVVVLLGGAVLNSGGGTAVAWAVGVALVAVAGHLLIGRRGGRSRRRRSR